MKMQLAWLVKFLSNDNFLKNAMMFFAANPLENFLQLRSNEQCHLNNGRNVNWIDILVIEQMSDETSKFH